MKSTDCYYLGHIAKSFGYEGSLIAFLNVGDPSSFPPLDAIFIAIEGKLVPFMVEEMVHRGMKGETLIRLEDVDTEDKARHLCHRKVYIPKDSAPEPKIRQTDHYEIKGYKAFDAKDQLLGSVDDILEYPGNPLFSIIDGAREILIPANKNFILEVNHQQRTIKLDPPDGLLELNK